ncbi:hypothetical protein OG413_15660 [Streptomyces sp. NBC_01433]|uniref:hypothetical protein n=1 Tax=Streptomyces sp. NBC_01433 TaxID=2903864 RepID=UPI00224ED828|nr:hypothetical protein [Streptomyces sp. NBC_01433]MCX4676721.1 hypothetical protein [Streptomyces sp. NBC_01433]
MAKKLKPSVTPERQPDSVIASPATVAACRADYVRGADARAAMAKQAARARRS